MVKSESQALADELARRASALASVRPPGAPDPAQATQWTPAVVTAMITSTLATIGAIVGLVVNRPTPPPSTAGLAQTRDVDAIEDRAQAAENAAKSARNDLKACRSQFKGLNERVRSLENPKGHPAKASDTEPEEPAE